MAVEISKYQEEWDNVIYCHECDEPVSVVLRDDKFVIKCLICGKELKDDILPKNMC